MSTIIELREQDETAINNQNADWSNTIDEPVTLYSGDTVSLKGAFVDSVAQNSQKITVKPDKPNMTVPLTTISMDFLYYFHDWGMSLPSGLSAMSDRTYVPANQTFGSGMDYMLCDRKVESASGVRTERITQVNFTNKKGGKIRKRAVGIESDGSTLGGVVMPFIYMAPGATTYTKFYIVVKFDNLRAIGWRNGETNGDNFKINQQVVNSVGGGFAQPISFPIYAQEGTFRPDPYQLWEGTGLKGLKTSTEMMSENNIAYVDIEKTFVDTGTVTLTPRTIRKSVTIASRDYSPDELAKTITKALTVTDSRYFSSVNKISNNPLLTSSKELYEIGNQEDKSDPNHDPTFVREDGLATCTYITDPTNPTGNRNYLIGTSQFALEFNQQIGGEGIFDFTQMHTPLSDINGNPVVKTIDLGNWSASATSADPDPRPAGVYVKADAQLPAGIERVKFVANKNGGIVITNLSPPGLWFGKSGMNFNTSIYAPIVPNTAPTTLPPGGTGTDAQYILSKFKLTDGLNATGALKSIDLTTFKNETFDIIPPFGFPNGSPSDPTPIPPPDVATPLLSTISAERAMGNVESGGYYQVEIGSNIFTDKRNGIEKKTNVMGIVSRFYQQNSYTSSIDGEGSFTYQHAGEPILLSNVRCRVLDPDGTLATGLDDNSAVFLQITRAQPTE